MDRIWVNLLPLANVGAPAEVNGRCALSDA